MNANIYGMKFFFCNFSLQKIKCVIERLSYFGQYFDGIKFTVEKHPHMKENFKQNFEVALEMASKNGHIDITKYFLAMYKENIDLQFITDILTNVVQYASQKKNILEIVTLYFDAFINEKNNIEFVNKFNSTGMTLLMCAAKRGGNLDLVKFLLEKGADLECKSKYGYDVLSFSSGSCYEFLHAEITKRKNARLHEQNKKDNVENEELCKKIVEYKNRSIEQNVKIVEYKDKCRKYKDKCREYEKKIAELEDECREKIIANAQKNLLSIFNS